MSSPTTDAESEKAADQLKQLTQRLKEATTDQDRMELLNMIKQSPEHFPELLKITKAMNFCPPMQMMRLEQQKKQQAASMESQSNAIEKGNSSNATD
ncbi:unnamed protein product [Auanema sp. JU1783]|nr:unnamed protein product [Auanema sp. JU1783]